MAAFIKQYLCCCLPQTGPSQEQHSHDDERQPLLNPDILPSAPSRPALRTTEQQQAEQDQLRHILHLAEQRLLSVESSAPFRQPEAASSSSPAPSRSRHRHHHHHHAHSFRPDLDHRSHSEASSTTTASTTSTVTASASRAGSRPSRSSRSRHRSARRRAAHEDGKEGRGSPSTSRHRVHPAAGDEGAGPLAPVRVVHLDRNTWTELESAPTGARKRNGRGGDASQQRPASSHSMKTLPRASQHPAGLSGLDSGEGASEELTREEDDPEAGEDDSQSTQFGTVDSYRTAREGGWLSTRQTDAGSAGSAGRNSRRHARDLWSHDGAEAASTNPEELSQAVERLEQEIETWTLPDHGPFVADLGKSGKNAE